MTPTPAQDRDDYLSTREAAERLGVAVRTIQLWVEAGVLTAWKTAGGHRRIIRGSVDALLAERSAAVGSAAAPGGRPASTAGPFRVLVVEDDPALRLLFELTLGTWGLPIEVAVADHGFAGLLRLGEGHWDLLITDLNMPGMDGFGMIRHLRADPRWQQLPIVVVTALDAREVAARGGLPPRVELLGKPVPFAQLEEIIRAAFARRATGA